MISLKRFTELYSATVLGTGNNNGIHLRRDLKYEFKSYYKLRVKGENTLKLFFVNEIESTGNYAAGEKGGEFEIESAYAAVTDDMEGERHKTILTFGGKEAKKVSPGEQYESDSFFITYDGKYLVLDFVLRAKERTLLPSTSESASTGRIIRGGKEMQSENFGFRPCFIGAKKDFKKTVGFMGDSITQGTRIEPDSYEGWSHRIGLSLEEDVSFWNLGMGWSRAYDAAADGVFLQKAAMCDEVFICFGVNDLRAGRRTAKELIGDLDETEQLLKKRNPEIKVYFLTVPPFNMTETEEAYRKEVNDYIKKNKSFFDIAKVLEADSYGSVKKEFMADECDAHPNGLAGKAVFESFLKWREENSW